MPSETSSRFRELVASLGRPTLGAIFPGEFEVYMMTLELVNSEDEIADYLSFPVMPDSIRKSEPEVTSVIKTAGGVVSLTTNMFNPQSLSIEGNFGRSFKILVGGELVNFKAFGASLKSLSKGKLQEMKSPFGVRVKTGYGCTKILQTILQKSTGLDEYSKPYKLFLHNSALGESYLVEKISFDLSMNKSVNNRMWKYSVEFKILGDLSMISDTGASSLLKILGTGVINKGVGILSGNIGEIIREGASNPLRGVEELI